jgi:hypothetical protein
MHTIKKKGPADKNTKNTKKTKNRQKKAYALSLFVFIHTTTKNTFFILAFVVV